MQLKGYVPPTSRPQRTEPALGCQDCFLFSQCGGTYAPGVFDCLAFCCNKPSTCTFVCPKSERFVEVLRDTGGLVLNQRWQIRQRATELPHYLPCIQHGSSRMKRLNFPLVVVPTCEVTRRREKPCETQPRFEQLSSCAVTRESFYPASTRIVNSRTFGM